MSIPTYDLFIEPILRYLAQHPEGALAREVYEAAASALDLSDTEKLELLPSKAQAVYKNRSGWAHDRLKRAGLSSSLRRGFWKLTDEGLDYFRAHPQPLTSKEVEELALSNLDVRLRPRDDASISSSNLQSSNLPNATQDDVATPDDRLERAVSELRSSTAEDLLETIGQGSPKFFEELVLDLLHAMGYGASRTDLQHVGRSNDGGIDGIISLDRLGLEKVFVQAKRWQGSIGREAIQAFYGAPRWTSREQRRVHYYVELHSTRGGIRAVG